MNREPTFIKILETDFPHQYCLIKSVLDGEGIQCFIQGENMKTIRPVDPAILMVAKEDVGETPELLKNPKLSCLYVKR